MLLSTQEVPDGPEQDDWSVYAACAARDRVRDGGPVRDAGAGHCREQRLQDADHHHTPEHIRWEKDVRRALRSADSIT